MSRTNRMSAQPAINGGKWKAANGRHGTARPPKPTAGQVGRFLASTPAGGPDPSARVIVRFLVQNQTVKSVLVGTALRILEIDPAIDVLGGRGPDACPGEQIGGRLNR